MLRFAIADQGRDAIEINTQRDKTNRHAQEHTAMMAAEIIDAAFAELKQLGQCKSRSEFSRNWLGREKSYYRSLQSKGRQPSAEAQINLIGRLRQLGSDFTRSDHPAVDRIGRSYLKLSGELLDALLRGT
jgi:hypothetical protein